MTAYHFLFALCLLVNIALNRASVLQNVGTDNNGKFSEQISARYRLPKEIVPKFYDLSIYTHPIEADYDGYVRIILQVLEKIDFVVLHTDALVVASTALSDESGRLIPVSRYLYEKYNQMLTIKFERALKPGEYSLEVSFKGRIADDVFGFYASLYEVDGKLRRIGVTQFSPIYARRAFPCMDEPYLKAEFQVRIGHHTDQIATSNTPVESTVKNGTYCVTTFRRTPRMPTYLVGWTVHNFVPEQSRISETFKMWTRDSMEFRGSMALNRGRTVYAALQTWLSVRSPLEKIDQFAIPDFNFNAMENWGLITYRESVVLHENETTPTRVVLNGLTTMAHEYAHSWFGNLVTPAFWDVVWLKEGFASYFQYFGVSLAMPDLRMMSVFVVDCLQPALLADSDNHTRMLNGRDVGSPRSIMATLDFVSYKKGASVIRMVSHIIGNAAFRSGLQSYLYEKSYEAASPSDLYRHLQIASDRLGQLPKHIPLKDVIESWANQSGYPVVTITRDYTTKLVVASQERFYSDRQAAQVDPVKSGWWIPLTFATEESKFSFDEINTTAWLKPQTKSTTIGSFEPESWVIFNVQQVGYYRVNYDENNWKMLINYLKSKDFQRIHVINRAALIDDAFNLARAGYVDYSIPFNVANYLARETEYEPWIAAVNNFNFLNRILAASPRVQRLFRDYVSRVLKPIYDLLSFTENPTDNSTTKLHRELILSAACSVNDSRCVRTSRILFKSWISASGESVPANLRSFVYCVGIREGDDNDWRALWNRFLRTDLHTEQELLLNALGCTKSPRLLDKYLDASVIYGTKLRKQYRMTAVSAVLNGNPENVNYTIDYIRKKLRAIRTSRGEDFVEKILTALGSKITTVADLYKFRLFVDENIEELGSALNSAKKAVAVSAASVAWINKYLPVIEQALLGI